VELPEVVAVGEPALGYPWTLGVYTWLDGEQPRNRRARGVIAALQRIELDVAAATAAWEAALATPPWPHEPVWLHGDLLEGNLLVRDGRLAGVIDWASVCVGDPAFDYHIAWSLLAPVRDAFRAACGVDDDTWAPARGLALE